MLLELAIGDAYGAAFEYVDYPIIEKLNRVDRYYRRSHHDISPGHYTDDAQMSLALAEVIVDNRPWTHEVLADAFVNAFKRDPPRFGYARGFYAMLSSVQDGKELLAQLRPDSDKSGGAMRAAPVGVFPTTGEVVERAAIQAAITHNTPDGIAAAKAAALMSHYTLYGLGRKADMPQFVADNVPERTDWTTPWIGQVGAKGWMSVRAALTAVVESSSMTQLLKRCVDFGGDVDTVATIALAAASASDEIEQDLPQVFVDDLENGKYGRDYIVALDKRLVGERDVKNYTV